MGVEPFLLASTVRLVLAQRLVRRLCPHCRAPRPLDTAAARFMGESFSGQLRSEEHTSELQSLMRISYAVFCLKKKLKPEHPTTAVNYILTTVKDHSVS